MPDISDKRLNSVISYFRNELSDRRVTEAMIDEAVDNDEFTANLDDKTRVRIKRTLKQQLFITQDAGAIITDECEPWLAARKVEMDMYYWARLREYLIGTGELPQAVVSRLDTATDEILDCCRDPLKPGPWRSRGMVMGHVQSGKTTNYAALITKAADAGYKVIILLAGITNSLRSQTQQRMDEYFIGRKSVFNAAAQAPLPILSYSGGRRRDPDFGTSRDQDFNRQNAIASAPFSALKEPKIFILKKNKSVLENLNVWIRDQAHGMRIDEPLLMIDDEADNASINTHQDPTRSTSINAAIREMLAQFKRSTFIGYTATPFANIFIDPDTSDDFMGEDLFPRNFIKALDPPTNYCGAKRYFTEEGDLGARSIVPVSDYADLLPLTHKKSIALEVLPPSLECAIRTFVLARAVRVLRSDGKKHCTMMVNASRFNDVQEKLEGKIYAYLTRLKQAITTWADSDTPLADPNVQDLKETFEREYHGITVEDAPITFVDVLPALKEASATIVVATVNMLKRSPLSYEVNKKEGLHVIAIGGLALSRGLTLEGLVTTYLLRNVGASDTLMQMARWFGYRTNYEDLCRIYLPGSAIAYYAETHLAIDELRDEVNRMSLVGGTPLDFGLKVRQSETGIRITAANKMRTATKMQLAAGYSGRFVQGHTIHNNQKVNNNNLCVAAKFLQECGPAIREGGLFLWQGQSGRRVVRLLEELEFPRAVLALAKLDGRRSLLTDYVSDRLGDELRQWDVCLVTRLKAAVDTPPVRGFLPPFELNPIERTSGKPEPEGKVYRFSRKKNAVGDQDTPKIGLTDDEVEEAKGLVSSVVENKYCRVRKRPLLVVFLVKVEKCVPAADLKDHAMSVAICLPVTQKSIREHTYQINKTLRAQMLDESQENADDDEAALNEG